MASDNMDLLDDWDDFGWPDHDAAEEDVPYADEPQPLPQTWTEASGRVRDIRSMEDAHLLNASRLLTRKISKLVDDWAYWYYDAPLGTAEPDAKEQVHQLNRKRQALRLELAKRCGVTAPTAAPTVLDLTRLVSSYGELECLCEQFMGETYERSYWAERDALSSSYRYDILS
jgi:hypothetical protein